MRVSKRSKGRTMLACLQQTQALKTAIAGPTIKVVNTQANDDTDEPDDYAICPTCAGSGEGYADGTRCVVCRGSGIERPSIEPGEEE